jgi:hypothetical protein
MPEAELSALSHRSRFTVHAALLAAFALFLAACATPPRPMMRLGPLTVVEVTASADFAKDAAFASDLQAALSAQVGRARAAVGQDVRLSVIVRGRSVASAPGAFTLPGQYFALADITLTDPASGRLIYSGTARQIAAPGPRIDANLVAGLVFDVRRLLGLEGTAPHPVGGVKKPAVRPVARPETVEIAPTDAALSDPLLNGTILPDSPPLDPDFDLTEPPAIDVTKPLLAPAPAPVATPSPSAAPASATEPAKPAQPAPDAAPAVKPAVAADADEPCIVTVDNDCQDPDAN